jgi:hypothetical protein
MAHGTIATPEDWQTNESLTIPATFKFTGAGLLHRLSIFSNHPANPTIPQYHDDIPFSQWLRIFATKWQQRLLTNHQPSLNGSTNLAHAIRNRQPIKVNFQD